MMDHPYPIEEHDARRMCGDPQALAYEWIKGYAANLSARAEDDTYNRRGGITAEELIETAMTHLPTEDDSNRWGDYLIRGGTFEGESTDP
ncbi:hypothetical protein SB717_34130, partial [Priestia sp. SIMBA_032]